MTLSVQLRHQFAGFALDVDFTAPLGITALFGRSGAGKTSVIRAIAGLLTPDAGRISLGGRALFGPRVNLAPHQRKIGYVFQEARLFPHMTVQQNLTYGGRADFDRVVDMLGIAPLLARRPAHLSGGEAQRVAIGRALLRAPDLLLLDEPLAALDGARKAEILPYLERLRDQAGVPIIYVSHSVDEVARLATTLVVIDAGRVIRAGPARDILSDIHASAIFGMREAGAIITGHIAAHEADGLTRIDTGAGPLFTARLAGDLGAPLRLRIHAQDVMIAASRPEGISALNILPTTVQAMLPEDGPSVMVQLNAGGQTLLARVTQRSAAALGLSIGASCFAIVKSVAVAQGDITGGQ